jgi:hypothetical protein
VAFVVVTLLLLGVIHNGTGASAAGGGTAAPTTTTTVPKHKTTTTTTTTLPAPPTNVILQVANGTTYPTGAGDFTTKLKGLGWTTLAPLDATTHVASSSIYYLKGAESAGDLLAKELHLSPSVVVPYTTSAPVSSIGTAELLLVLGPDLTSTLPPVSTTSG